MPVVYSKPQLLFCMHFHTQHLDLSSRPSRFSMSCHCGVCCHRARASWSPSASLATPTSSPVSRRCATWRGAPPTRWRWPGRLRSPATTWTWRRLTGGCRYCTLLPAQLLGLESWPAGSCPPRCQALPASQLLCWLWGLEYNL